MSTNQEQADQKDQNPSGFWEFLDHGPRTSSIITALSVILLVFILRSVLIPFIIACILAALTWPFRNKILKLTRNRATLTSGILVFGLILVVATPVSLISFLATLQAKELMVKFDPQTMVHEAGAIGKKLEQWEITRQLGLTEESLAPKLQESLASLGAWGMDQVLGMGGTLLHALILTGIMLMSLFYLYQSGDQFVLRLQSHLPLSRSETDVLLDTFRRTSRAIFKGNFVIGGIQGLMTGLLFWATGLPSPAFFGVAAALCSLIPAVGTGLIWAPGALVLLVTGHTTAGLVVLGVGVGVISMIDSVLRPILVGRDAGMHDLMVFLTTLGGLSFFGPVGILFGPLVGAGVMALLRLRELPAASEDQEAGSRG
ncbi:MAG TPA: AI-2E family transporter [Fibrobacteria bacterium]|nr:AI-2E family transporter [Fibrobacteria bacterium]